MVLQEVLNGLLYADEKRPQLDILKHVGKKDLTGKGKYMVKAEDQPLEKLVWRLKDKSSKLNYNYNK